MNLFEAMKDIVEVDSRVYVAMDGRKAVGFLYYDDFNSNICFKDMFGVISQVGYSIDNLKEFCQFDYS